MGNSTKDKTPATSARNTGLRHSRGACSVIGKPSDFASSQLALKCTEENFSGGIKHRAHTYEIRPLSDKRGVDLISDALPFGRLW